MAESGINEPGRRKGATVLIVIAVAAAALLTTVNDVTRQKIAANELEEKLRGLREVLPEALYNNEPHLDSTMVLGPDLLGSESPQPVYRARKNGQPVAAALKVIATNGYAGPIELLVGIDWRGRVTGVRVLKHRETPGLGDAIETRKSDWILKFSGLQTLNPLAPDWVLKREGGEFDHISGATVTSRAVLNAVRDAVIYFTANRTAIFVTPVDLEATP